MRYSALAYVLAAFTLSAVAAPIACIAGPTSCSFKRDVVDILGSSDLGEDVTIKRNSMAEGVEGDLGEDVTIRSEPLVSMEGDLGEDVTIKRGPGSLDEDVTI
ncbi:hypothetical protein BKA62DRAFT_760091 [Auriculariales sp. MPI-PUGE-AT-0066]|nr:hypothetical protein BKA62DRAFT_760091 [Auriculariales sp. MPI-PUGE-AT-0066]